jgi:hypothetical protein
VVASADIIGLDGVDREALATPALPLPLVDEHFPRSRAYLRAVLSAPLKPGGTPQRLGAWRAERHAGVDLHVAKSGTTRASGNAGTRDAYVVGGFVYRGRRYTYVALIGSPDPRTPVGHDIHGADAAPLVDAVLTVLLGGQQ